VDNATKNKYTNIFQPLEKENNEVGRGNDRVREGSVSDASSSRGSRMRDPVTLTPEILAMLERHEPDKVKQAKMLIKHLSGQMTRPSTEEDLEQHLERKAKRETDRLMAAAEAEATTQDKIKQAEAAKQAHNAIVIATFAKRAKDAAIAARASTKNAEAARKAAAAEVETTFADTIAMHE